MTKKVPLPGHFFNNIMIQILLFCFPLHKPHHHQLIAHQISDHDPYNSCEERNPRRKADGSDQFTWYPGIDRHLKNLPECHGLVSGFHIQRDQPGDQQTVKQILKDDSCIDKKQGDKDQEVDQWKHIRHILIRKCDIFHGAEILCYGLSHDRSLDHHIIL